MAELSHAYHATRERIAALARELDADGLARRVPACPDWDAHDLLAHVSGMPEAITSGDLPGDDLQGWLDGLVEKRKGVPVDELLDRWAACAEPVSAMIDSGVDLLVVDLVCHEHDLRGAVGRPGERGSAEVRAIVQPQLDALVPGMKEAGLGALVIDAEGVQWASHLAKPGCTLRIDPWEASRVLESRRTADEIRALPHAGDVEPYIDLIAAHLPLPAAPLEER
jgi:uncharacterized protein (TIGR03083 family)